MKHASGWILRYFSPYCLLWCLLGSGSAQALTFIEAKINNSGGITGLQAASALALEPQAAQLYATGFNDDSIVVFNRSSNGVLSFSQSLKNGSAGITGLDGPNAVLVSADGKQVYVAGLQAGAIVTFNRNASTGQLSFSEAVSNGVRNAAGLAWVNHLSLSPDDKHLYATSGSGGLSVFSRDSSNGLLSFVELQQNGTASVTNLTGASAVLVSSGGLFVYVAASGSDSVVAFRRDTGSGRLTFAGSYQNGSSGITGLGGAYGLRLSPDGLRLFVAANGDNALTVFNRNSSDGSLSFSGSYQDGVAGVDGLLGVRTLRLSPDGSRLYAAGNSESALATFAVSGSTLTFLAVAKNGVAGVTGIGGISDIVISPDNGQLYTTGLLSHAVAHFSTKAADLGLSQSVTASPVVNTPLTVSVTVTNNGPDAAGNVTLTNALPTGLSLLSSTATQGQCSTTANSVSCGLGALAANTSARVDFQLQTSTAGRYTHSVQVSGSDPDTLATNNSSSTAIDVASQLFNADMQVTLSASPTPVNANGEVVLSAQLVNLGPDSATHVGLDLTWPAAASFRQVLPSQGSCAAPASNSLHCDLGTLAANAQTQVNLTLIAPAQLANLTAQAAVSASQTDPNNANNSASQDVPIQALRTDLSLLNLKANATSVTLGQTLSYSMDIANLSTTDTSSVVVTDVFTPSTGLRFISASTTAPSAATPNAPCVEQAPGQLQCALGTLLANSGPFQLQINVLPTLPGSLSSQATVSGNASEQNATDNSQTLATSITGELIDLAVTLSATPNPAVVNNSLVFTATIQNTGTATAQAVRLSNPLPSGVDYVGALPSQGSCSETAGSLSCVLGDIAGNASATVRITLLPRTVSSIQSSVQLSSNSFDPNPANDTATLVVDAGEARADLSAQLTATPNPVTVEDELSYQLTIQNAGPATASSVNASVQLPSAFLFIAATTSQGSACNLTDTSNSLTCPLGSLAQGNSATVSLRVVPQQSGAFTTSSSVSAIQADPNSANNSVNLPLTVNATPSLRYVQAYIEGKAGMQGLQSANDLALSPDGKHLYVAGFQGQTLAVLARDTATGQLSFIQSLTNTSAGVALGKLSSVAVSHDGKQVYLASYSSNSLHIFQRNLGTGQLSASQTLVNGTAGVSGLLAPYGLATHGNSVYVGSLAGQAIAVFQRDASTDVLSFQEAQTNGVNQVTGLGGVNTLRLSADGSRLYATGITDNALVVFERNQTSGALQFRQSFISGNQNDGGFTGAAGLAISPDQAHIYVAGSTDGAISLFRRNSADGSLSYVSKLGGIAALNSVSGLAISPDGAWLYAAGTNSLLVFSRDPTTGTLALNIIHTDAQQGVDGLAGVRAITLSSGGDSLYAASLLDNAVAMFRPPLADLAVTIQAEPEPASTGQPLNYLVRITNHGPEAASAVTLSDTLPATVSLVSATPSKGLPCTGSSSLLCRIGQLNAGETTTVSIVVTPSAQGSLSHTASITGLQPDPNTSNNQATATSHVVGTANLQVSLRDVLDPALLDEPLEYRVTLTNTGPDQASNLVLQSLLPASVTLVSAMIGTQPCTQANNQVTCTLASLDSQAEALAVIRVQPSQVGLITHLVTLSADQADPSLPNQATESTEISQNIISTRYDNSGGTLTNYTITSSGVVNNGNLGGKTNNHGLLNNVNLLSAALITGDGRLSGSINSQGVIENAVLLAGTQVQGGTIRGTLRGEFAPGEVMPRVTAQIEAGAQLSQVIIGAGALVDPGAQLGAGVLFAQAADLPTGINLARLFNTLSIDETGAQALLLNRSVLVGRETLLEAINQLPLLRDNNWAFVQLSTGGLLLQIGDLALHSLPVRVTQEAPGFVPGIELLANGRVRCITAEGQRLIAQPALQRPDAPAALLQSLQLAMQADSAGNLNVTTADSSVGRLLLRPDWLITAPSTAETASFVVLPTQLAGVTVPGLNWLALLFDDTTGQRRQQVLYSAPADAAAWQTLASQVQLDEFNINYNGTLSFKVDAVVYQALFDYSIFPGTGGATTGLTLAPLPDANGDGIDDFLVSYPNGEQQKLFFLPPAP